MVCQVCLCPYKLDFSFSSPDGAELCGHSKMRNGSAPHSDFLDEGSGGVGGVHLWNLARRGREADSKQAARIPR